VAAAAAATVVAAAATAAGQQQQQQQGLKTRRLDTGRFMLYFNFITLMFILAQLNASIRNGHGSNSSTNSKRDTSRTGVFFLFFFLITLMFLLAYERRLEINEGSRPVALRPTVSFLSFLVEFN
jgi:hypothetical protein